MSVETSQGASGKRGSRRMSWTMTWCRGEVLIGTASILRQTLPGYSPSPAPEPVSRPPVLAPMPPLPAVEPPLILLIAPAMPTPPGVCVVVPVGVVTVIRLLSLGSRLHSMR